MIKKFIEVFTLMILLVSCTSNTITSQNTTNFDSTQKIVKNLKKTNTQEITESPKEIEEIVLDRIPTDKTLTEQQIKELKWKSISSERIIKQTDETISKLRQEMEKEIKKEREKIKLDSKEIIIK